MVSDSIIIEKESSSPMVMASYPCIGMQIVLHHFKKGRIVLMTSTVVMILVLLFTLTFFESLNSFS